VNTHRMLLIFSILLQGSPKLELRGLRIRGEVGWN
jgi:hypothetical protein